MGPEKSGVELDRKSLDIVSGTLRMRGDRILVKPLPLKLSGIIEAEFKGKTVRGEVLAVGPGEYPNVYNSDRSRVWRSKAFRATQVKVGDVVELGGLDIGGYSFPRMLVNGEDCIIATEKDVCGVEV